MDVAYRHGLVVEPAGAAALAALLSGKVLFPFLTLVNVNSDLKC